MAAISLWKICNAIFKANKYAETQRLFQSTSCKHLEDLIQNTYEKQSSQRRSPNLHVMKLTFVIDKTLYCVFKNMHKQRIYVFGNTAPIAYLVHRTHSKWVLEDSDICMLAYLFYANSFINFYKITANNCTLESVRVINKDWKQILSVSTLNIVRNTPTCSEFVFAPDGKVLFRNNYHITYHPLKIFLKDNCEVQIRLPFHRMSWNEVFEQVKDLLLLHSLQHALYVQLLYEQFVSMQNGSLSFYTSDVDGANKEYYGYDDETISSWRRIRSSWINIHHEIKTHLLIQPLVSSVWEYCFDVKRHTDHLTKTRVPRSKSTMSNTTWKGPYIATVLQ